jgi:hypothetical protein
MSTVNLTYKLIQDKATLEEILSSNRKSIGDIFSPKAKVATTAANTPAKDSKKRNAGNKKLFNNHQHHQ